MAPCHLILPQSFHCPCKVCRYFQTVANKLQWPSQSKLQTFCEYMQCILDPCSTIIAFGQLSLPDLVEVYSKTTMDQHSHAQHIAQFMLVLVGCWQQVFGPEPFSSLTPVFILREGCLFIELTQEFSFQLCFLVQPHAVYSSLVGWSSSWSRRYRLQWKPVTNYCGWQVQDGSVQPTVA